VLQLAHDDQGWYLLAIAFGKRHPTADLASTT
jgi:hypothetical protein